MKARQEREALPGFRRLILHPYSLLVMVSISIGRMVGGGDEVPSHICSQSVNAQCLDMCLFVRPFGVLEPKSGSVIVECNTGTPYP